MLLLHEKWLTHAENLCVRAGQKHIDVLVDRAGSSSSLQEAIRDMDPPVSWHSLFENTPEEALTEEAPLLMRLDLSAWQHKTWLSELMQHFQGTPRLLLAITPLPFEQFAQHLHTLAEVKWGEQTGLLRFYDTRIFPLLFSHVLTQEQQMAFSHLALLWGWLDRDRHIVWKAGIYEPGNKLPEKPDPISVEDVQIEMLGCISDAQNLMPQFDRESMTKEQHFSRCFDIALDASRNGYLGELFSYAMERMKKT
ncbi:hypothetical protein ED28_06975 [[Pantoea] beijingensis]|uniref:DUF4123 domain-containing protein n=1 Tax=[Pantoea] beijingensis TaxID=1324864 RepID=A0A443IEX5_9GAMM|nr:DUF4123 domain-containing protein [[Pantoea] beijingensis]RWR02600.1 hypothetical protein ED28_06975 [[Pantoea] beijingensis]